MINLNATQSSTTNSSAEQTEDNQGTVIFGVVLLASALLGCSLALLALGRDFFIGKNVPIVFVGALVWVDFIGVFSTAVLIFHGLIEGERWMADSPQCSLQVCKIAFTTERVRLTVVLLLSLRPYLIAINLPVPFTQVRGSRKWPKLKQEKLPKFIAQQCQETDVTVQNERSALEKFS